VIDGYPQIPPEVESEAQSALGNLSAALKAKSADADRAMGTYLEIVATWQAAASEWHRTHGDCAQDDAACQSAEAQAEGTAAAERRAALVRLATTTTDPEAYALAAYACPPTGDPSKPQCTPLHYAQWARIEPDNAVPWLYLAGEAERRHDRGAFEAAIDRASKSRYSDPHWDPIQRLLASDLVGAESSPVQAELAILLLGVHAALGHPAFTVMQYCRQPDQANLRIETCTNLAAMLIGHGRTALDALTGRRIAEAIGWNDPRLTALHDQADAVQWQLSQRMKSAAEEGRTLFSCDGLQRLRHRAAAEARLGEAELLRRELADAGISVSQAAELWRAEVRQQSLKAK
jgi:hypothetical protein